MVKLKPILEEGEQIYNWLKEHFEYKSSYEPGFNEVMPIMSKPQVIILPPHISQKLIKYMSDNDIGLQAIITNNGELDSLGSLFGCDVYISGYAEEIEIF